MNKQINWSNTDKDWKLADHMEAVLLNVELSVLFATESFELGAYKWCLLGAPTT